jgi:hypothetical protein
MNHRGTQGGERGTVDWGIKWTLLIEPLIPFWVNFFLLKTESPSDNLLQNNSPNHNSLN